jgi:3-deoxy-D-manno-octulosonic-acid transferase
MVPPRDADRLGHRALALKHPTVAHHAYRLLIRGAMPLMLAWLWWRGRKDPGYRENLGQRLGFIEPTAESVGGLLVHAASVGEVMAARPLLASLLKDGPAWSITVSTQSPTGARTLSSQWGQAMQHVFIPIDTPGATARFLDRLQPRAVVLIERELWPELLLQCRLRNIPVALVNARLSGKSFAIYQRLSTVMSPVWAQLAVVAAADTPSLDRYRALGVPEQHLLMLGNLKFDQSLCTPALEQLPWLEGRPVVVAASTHDGEEAELLDAWPDFGRQHPGALLILVPRHPERFEVVAHLLSHRGHRFARRSLGQVPDESTSVLLGDTMGELDLWYRHASLSFIGGSLVPIGGHNALEALACGHPVLFGPHTRNFQSLYEELPLRGIGASIESGRELFATASRWLADAEALARMGQKARDFVRAQQGSSERCRAALNPLWRTERPMARVAQQDLATQTLWHDPAILDHCTPSLFEAAPGAQTLATGSGRGQVQRWQLGEHDLLLRHYRRGGLMARLSPDRYAACTPSGSRAMSEFSLLRRLRAWGLPVPEPVAARQLRSGGWGYSADIVVAMIPDSHNVAQLLSVAALTQLQWQTLGHAIRRLHEHQVFHSDLNCHNLLLDSEGRAWIVDFDKCGVRSGTTWKAENLERLRRSLRKELRRRSGFQWRESDWIHLLAGYNGP